MQPTLQEICVSNQIKGTILLAEEGINGTVAGSRQAIDALKVWLNKSGLFSGMEYKESFADAQPFLRMKVRLKNEIVTMGVPDADPVRQTGHHVGPEEWNQLIDDPDVLVIDTRNEYETKIGSFDNAISPGTDSFRQFPEYVDKTLDPHKHRKIAMFCTGGIRCEKASAHLLDKGFQEVYQLNGGILRYLDEVIPEQSRWQGECFVFDERVSVNAELAPGEHTLCFGCRSPLTPEEVASRAYEKGVCCPHCVDNLDDDKRAALRERQKQIELAEARGEQHMGQEMNHLTDSP